MEAFVGLRSAMSIPTALSIPRDALLARLSEHDGVLIGPDGAIRLTARRRSELTHWFALAGINLASIRTIDEYIAARERAAPYFDEWLRQLVRSGPPSLERDLLMACVEGDDAQVARLRLRLANVAARGDVADDADAPGAEPPAARSPRD
jgi:hypothetical protein